MPTGRQAQGINNSFMKRLIIAVAIALIAVVAIVIWKTPRAPSVLIVVASPKDGDVISSPLVFSGKARGYWYFEASFPVRVIDANGNELGVGIAQAQDEWMTEAFVPFAGTVEFLTPETPTGKVIFQKDNPSGLPEHDAAVEVPVRFAPPFQAFGQ